MKSNPAKEEEHRIAVIGALKACGIFTESLVFNINLPYGEVSVDLSASELGSIGHQIARQAFEQGADHGAAIVQDGIKRTLGISP